MERKIIEIDRARCNGCGLCVTACHEGALVLENGKARLISDSYCDGLGDCLPECPVGAIQIIRREAAAYDQALVDSRQRRRFAGGAAFAAGDHPLLPHLQYESIPQEPAQPASALGNWPVQLALVSTRAPELDGAHLLIAADCTAYAYPAFHRDFLQGRVTLIGCPKLDRQDYAAKLTEIVRENDPASITVLRMEVPCCAGLVEAVRTAIGKSGRVMEWQSRVISTEGEIVG